MGRNRIRGRPSTPSTGRTGPGGWGRPARSPARSCPTTTCSTPTPPSPWSPSTAFATLVKHPNPCGAAFGATLEEAYTGALEGDPVSAFGGVVGLSRPLDAATAKRIAAVFTEVVVAPAFEEEALAVLAGKPSLRLVRVALARPARWLPVRSVAGGLLAQEPDPGGDDPAGWVLQAGDPPGPELLADLALAWSVAGHVRSNA